MEDYYWAKYKDTQELTIILHDHTTNEYGDLKEDRWLSKDDLANLYNEIQLIPKPEEIQKLQNESGRITD